jgi:predicted nucleotidyltransferase
MYGLSEATIVAIHHVLQRYSAVDQAILYGSRAIGNERIGSDIDLTLIGEALDLTCLQKMECDLDDLPIPYQVDLSIMKQIRNPELLDHIQRVGKIFYDRELIYKQSR